MTKNALKYFKICKFVGIIFFSIPPILFNSTPIIGQSTNEIYNEIYSYNFHSAFQQIKKTNIEEKEKATLWVNFYWWLAVSGENETANFSNCTIWLDKLDNIISAIPNSGNEFLYYKIMIHAYKARLAMFYGNYLSAGLNIHYCNGELTESLQNVQQFEKLYFSSGLYYYFVENSLHEYPVLYPYFMFFPKGNKKLGIEYLQRAAQMPDLLLKTESIYFLMRIYFEFEKNYSLALVYADKLIQMYPNNLVYRYYKIQILKKTNNIPEYEREFAELQLFASNNSGLSDVQKMHFVEIISNSNMKTIQ